VTALILGGLVAVAAVVIVSLPFLREPGTDELNESTPATEAVLAMMEARDRSLGALKELEFDHRSGKIDDDDYRQLVGPLRRAAAESLQALDRLKTGKQAELAKQPASPEQIESPEPPKTPEQPETPGPLETPDGPQPQL
jgi:hypothetical protein